MKLGFLTACLPKVKLEDLVKWSSEQGFQTLELAAWPVKSSRDYQARQIDAEKLTKDDAERIKDLFAENKMEISAMAYYDNNLHPNKRKREKYLKHLKNVIDAAELLDVELVGTFVGGRDASPDLMMKEIGKEMRKIVKYAADKGRKIMIENCPMDNWVKFGLPGNYAYSPETWDALFNEVSDENFGLNMDPSHLYWLGIDYIQVLKDYAPKIFHAHAKDTEILPDGLQRYGILGQRLKADPWKSGWWRYRIPGLGEIDWMKFITTLQEVGYDYALSIEHEDPVWEGSQKKVKDGLKLGLKHLSQFVV